MQTYVEQLKSIMPTRLTGSVVRTEGMTVQVASLPAPVGAMVEIERQTGGTIQGEVIGFRGKLTLVYPFSDITGVRHGNRVRLKKTSRCLRVGEQLLGRVIDAHGRTIDEKPPLLLPDRVQLDRRPPSSVDRPQIDQPISTGIRAIDGMLTCGRGQRMGIFSGSGVGKSVTLGMMARYTSADINVIGLIGERGREVNEFIQRDLGASGLARSVVVVATSDEPALLRVQAAKTASAVAEYFRDQGKNVMLMMDSITRFAMAQREIGLAAGEPPTTRGYPPSVFAMLPKLIERAGCSPKGSITAFYSVLVEGDDTNEPISDAVRGLLDGHTILSRKIAARGRYPAIDVLESISRLMTHITPPEQVTAAMLIKQLMAVYQENEDLITIGAYRAGSNPTVDAAIAMRDEIESFLRQQIEHSSSVDTAKTELLQLAQKCAEAMKTPAAAPRQAAAPVQQKPAQQTI